MNHDQKETAIEAIRSHGTMKAGAESAGVSVRTLNDEMRRSAIFKRKILEAREEGKRNIADKAIELIKSYAYGENTDKTDRNRLTAAIALANAYEPGFRGTTTVQGKIDHDVRVITAVPRPKYEVKELDNPPKKMLKSGITSGGEAEALKNGRPPTSHFRKKEIRDEQGNLIGVQTVEEAIEGAVINDNRNNPTLV